MTEETKSQAKTSEPSLEQKSIGQVSDSKKSSSVPPTVPTPTPTVDPEPNSTPAPASPTLKEKPKSPQKSSPELTPITENTITEDTEKITEVTEKITENKLSDAKVTDTETVIAKSLQKQEIKKGKESAAPTTESTGENKSPVKKTVAQEIPAPDEVKVQTPVQTPEVEPAPVSAPPALESTEDKPVSEKPITEGTEKGVEITKESQAPTTEPVGEEKQLSPKPPKQKEPKKAEAAPKPVIKRTIDPEASFALKFRFKLRELRERANRKRREKAEEHKEKIMIFAQEHNRIDNQDVQKITGLLEDRAGYYLSLLEKQGKLIQFGKRGPKVFYKPIK